VTRSPAKNAKNAKKSRPRARRAAAAAPEDIVAQLRRIERDGGDGILLLGEGATLAVSSLDKVYFPKEGITKGALMRYYARMAPVLLPELQGRPLALRRYPSGIEGDSFFQHDPGEHVPDAVRTAYVLVETGVEERRLIGGELATLLYTVQLGAIPVNAWHSRLGTLDTPDYAVLDLDPGPQATFRRVVDVAKRVHAQLSQQGLIGVPKTSGSRGIHILVPLPPDTGYDVAARLAEEVATAVVETAPEVATVERALADRPPGTVYVDHMQNAYGKTLVAVYSARARPGGPVSAPLSWRQVTAALDPKRWTVATVPGQRRALAERWSSQMSASNTRVRTEFGGGGRGR
jgi:bifunctional non-homologous end joining protein LigD